MKNWLKITTQYIVYYSIDGVDREEKLSNLKKVNKLISQLRCIDNKSEINVHITNGYSVPLNTKTQKPKLKMPSFDDLSKFIPENELYEYISDWNFAHNKQLTRRDFTFVCEDDKMMSYYIERDKVQ